MIYAQSTEHPTHVDPRHSPVNPTICAAQPAAYRQSRGGGIVAANAPAAGQPFQVALPRGIASEERLQVKTIWAARAISLLFPQIKTIYGIGRIRCPGIPTDWRST